MMKKKKRTKIPNPLESSWEFETNEGWLADQFLVVLEMFHIYPYDTYIPSFLDMSNIEFRATKAVRKQIEYVFLSVLKLNYMRQNKSIVELEGGDWYAIY